MNATIRYEDFNECPKCGGVIDWGAWFYDPNYEAQVQKRSCTACGFRYHAVYSFLVNLDENYEDFEDVEDEEVK